MRSRHLLGWVIATAVFCGAALSHAVDVLPQHPRLYFRKDDLGWVRRRCATTHQYWYRLMRSWCDAQAELGGGDGVELAMLYQLTGDDRYAKAAMRATEMSPVPGVYDLLYEELDPAARERYGSRILPSGQNIASGVLEDYFFTCANAERCLALYGDGIGDEKASASIRYILKAAPATFNDKGKASPTPGAWASTFHCGCFVRNLLAFYDQWLVATGENRFVDTYVQASQGAWYAHHLLPCRWTLVPTSTAWWGEGKTVDRAAVPEVAGRTADGVAQHFMNNYRKYCSWEFAGDEGGYGYVKALDPSGTGLSYWHGGVNDVYRLILHYDPKQPERPLSALPLTAFYKTWGHACMRTSWNDDAVYSLFKCGWWRGGEPPNMDDGAFFIYHKGDLVMENDWPVLYGKNYHLQTVNQNSITVLDPEEKIRLLKGTTIGDGVIATLNDGGQSFYDTKQTEPFDRGTVVAFEEDPLYTYVAGDATRSYNPAKMREFVRQYVYVKPNYFVVFDRVSSAKPEFEKRFCLHTRTQPELAGDILRADASELLLPSPKLDPIYPWKYGNYLRDTVPGFHQPEYENFEADWTTVTHAGDEQYGKVVESKAPNRTVTLRFEARFDGEEIAILHNAAPQYGEVQWSLDDGKQKGAFSQRADAPAFQHKQTLATDLTRGPHVLKLVSPAALMNVELFEVKLGGRMFCRTMLPKGAKIAVVEGFPESNTWQPRDRYAPKRRFRLEVKPGAPATDDVFLHVIQVGDLKTEKMAPMKLVEDGGRCGVEFDADGRRCVVTFNRTGAVGGRIMVDGAQGKLDRALTDKVNDLRDEGLEASLAEARNIRYYDYETKELGGLGPDADAARLREALRDAKWYIRYHAARMLGMKGAGEAEKDLIAALSDGDARVASVAAEALGRLKSEAGVAPLTATLSSPDATVRFSAAWALGRIGKDTPQAVQALAAGLADADPFVVGAAADAIGMLNAKPDPAVVAALVKVTDTPDHLARARTAETLGRLKSVEAVPTLKKLAEAGDASERLAALRALGAIGGDDAAAFLRAYISGGKGQPVDRLAAARALAGGVGDDSGLRTLLAEKSDAARLAAVSELVRRGDKAALAMLVADLKSGDFRTRQSAGWSLYKLNDKQGLIVIARDLLSADYGTRTAARPYLAYARDVLGDKRPVARALIDAVVEFVSDDAKMQADGLYEQMYPATTQIKVSLGRELFDWNAFKQGPEGRAKYKSRLLDWWEGSGQSLPETTFKE